MGCSKEKKEAAFSFSIWSYCIWPIKKRETLFLSLTRTRTEVVYIPNIKAEGGAEIGEREMGI